MPQHATLPGFRAEAGMSSSARRYRHAGARRSTDPVLGVVPAVSVYTGHCGCIADQLFGLPCVCIDFTPDPPPIVPVPDWEMHPQDAGPG